MTFLTRIYAFIEDHAFKVGAGGSLATVSIETWSRLASISVAAATVLALLPVIISRWRKFFNGKDVE